jgi:hypothetical protein
MGLAMNVTHYAYRPVQIGDYVEVKIGSQQWYGTVINFPGDSEGFVTIQDSDGYYHFEESSNCTPMENKSAR